MKSLWMATAMVGLVAASSLGVVSVQIVSDKSTLNLGETAVITIKVKAPAGVGVSALAGSINASGPGLTASGFAFASAFNRPAGEYMSVLGAAGANGGWASFGSGQNAQLMNNTTATYGANTWVNFATYTVTGAYGGDSVTLSFAPAEVGGFLLVSTDKDETLGTNASVTLSTILDCLDCRGWGDIDMNGFVDGDDLAILAYAWLQGPNDPQWYAPADLDGSGFVDGDDLAILAYGWLQ